MKKIVLTGGGTAGHVMPALALVPELKRAGFECFFIGGDGMEKDIVPDYMPYYKTVTVKLDRTHPLKNLKIPVLLNKGVAQATDILKKLKPDVVFSKGGYASLPTVFAAKKLSIPIVIHESDYSLGVANKVASKFAAATLTSFPETKGGVFVGNPVRREILCGNKQNVADYFADRKKKVVLIFGGSLGAEALNRAVYAALPELTDIYNVVHISGNTGDLTIKRRGYRQIKFTSEISDIYALCDIAVCRAGANSLAELAALGKPAVAVPLPKGNSRGDQEENAASYARRGCCVILKQEELSPTTLLNSIEKGLSLPPYPPAHSDADKKIVEKIVECVKST